MSEFENPNNLADGLLERAQKAEAELERAQKMFQWLAKSRDDWKRIACDNEARAVKAEAELESAQKMCDHWEAKAAERQGQVCDWKARAEKSEASVKALHDTVAIWRTSKLQEFRLEQAWDKLKRQRDLMNPVDWERVRIEAAMQGALAPEAMVYFADALVAKLQKKEVQG